MSDTEENTEDPFPAKVYFFLLLGSVTCYLIFSQLSSYNVLTIF